MLAVGAVCRGLMHTNMVIICDELFSLDDFVEQK